MNSLPGLQCKLASQHAQKNYSLKGMIFSQGPDSRSVVASSPSDWAFQIKHTRCA
jgi:hypothetical protein